MDPLYMPLYTSSSERDRSCTGTNLRGRGRALEGDGARPRMDPLYMPLYTSASERDRSRTGTHLRRQGRAL